ncbi:hypothetical protein [Peptostreptococcus faecalis]|uniref:hypothetical protein n=1 Tax=Peptostreptococcus faecalis TaxID=2045015 RepID=UPI000C7AA393|nr:hypothetical protein [Peptostreptococcus faecalis]
MALINVNRDTNDRPISVELKDIANKECVNGQFISISHPTDEANQELFEGVKLDASLPVGIIDEPFHPYEKSEQYNDMAFPVGARVRVRYIEPGLEMTVSKADSIKGQIALGDFVTIVPGDHKLTKVAAPKEGETAGVAVGRITRVYKFNRQDSVKIEFL